MARFEVSVSLDAAMSSKGWEMRDGDTAAVAVIYQAERGQNMRTGFKESDAPPTDCWWLSKKDISVVNGKDQGGT